MASRLNPYINFNGNARQALQFYNEVFGGTLTMNTFGDLGVKDSPDAEKIMHGMLETNNGFTLMGSDLPTGMEHRPGNTMSVSLSGDDVDQLRGYWAKLTRDGTVSAPLEKQAWGDEFGMCVDQFGVVWLVDIGGVEE